METAIIDRLQNIDRQNLYDFCDKLPEPVLARPIVTATRGRGLTLALAIPGGRVTLTEDGKPYKFCSIDEIMFELDGTPNLDTSGLVIETSNYWTRAAS